jgi:hypothetical protein
MRPLSSLTLIALIVVVLRTQIQAEDFFRQNHISLGYTGTSSGSTFHTDFFYETAVKGIDRMFFLPRVDITKTQTGSSLSQNQLIQAQLNYFIDQHLFISALTEQKIVTGREDILGFGPGVGLKFHGTYHFVMMQGFWMNDRAGWSPEFQAMVALGVPIVADNGAEVLLNWFHDQDYSTTTTLEIGSFSQTIAPILPMSVCYKTVASPGLADVNSVIIKLTSKL